MESLILFLISLFGTLLIVRVGAHNLHDIKNYNKNNPKNSKAKTITGLLRRKTGFDWHHIHIGLIILIILIPFFIIYGLNNIEIVFLGISLSLIVDQIIPLIYNKTNYFSKKQLIISMIFHIIIALIAIMIF